MTKENPEYKKIPPEIKRKAEELVATLNLAGTIPAFMTKQAEDILRHYNFTEEEINTKTPGELFDELAKRVHKIPEDDTSLPRSSAESDDDQEKQASPEALALYQSFAHNPEARDVPQDIKTPFESFVKFKENYLATLKAHKHAEEIAKSSGYTEGLADLEFQKVLLKSAKEAYEDGLIKVKHAIFDDVLERKKETYREKFGKELKKEVLEEDAVQFSSRFMLQTVIDLDRKMEQEKQDALFEAREKSFARSWMEKYAQLSTPKKIATSLAVFAGVAGAAVTIPINIPILTAAITASVTKFGFAGAVGAFGARTSLSAMFGLGLQKTLGKGVEKLFASKRERITEEQYQETKEDIRGTIHDVENWLQEESKKERIFQIILNDAERYKEKLDRVTILGIKEKPARFAAALSLGVIGGLASVPTATMMLDQLSSVAEAAAAEIHTTQKPNVVKIEEQQFNPENIERLPKPRPNVDEYKWKGSSESTPPKSSGGASSAEAIIKTKPKAADLLPSEAPKSNAPESSIQSEKTPPPETPTPDDEKSSEIKDTIIYPDGKAGEKMGEIPKGVTPEILHLSPKGQVNLDMRGIYELTESVDKEFSKAGYVDRAQQLFAEKINAVATETKFIRESQVSLLKNQAIFEANVEAFKEMGVSEAGIEKMEGNVRFLKTSDIEDLRKKVSGFSSINIRNENIDQFIQRETAARITGELLMDKIRITAEHLKLLEAEGVHREILKQVKADDVLVLTPKRLEFIKNASINFESLQKNGVPIETIKKFKLSQLAELELDAGAIQELKKGTYNFASLESPETPKEAPPQKLKEVPLKEPEIPRSLSEIQPVPELETETPKTPEKPEIEASESPGTSLSELQELPDKNPAKTPAIPEIAPDIAKEKPAEIRPLSELESGDDNVPKEPPPAEKPKSPIETYEQTQKRLNVVMGKFHAAGIDLETLIGKGNLDPKDLANLSDKELEEIIDIIKKDYPTSPVQAETPISKSEIPPSTPEISTIHNLAETNKKILLEMGATPESFTHKAKVGPMMTDLMPDVMEERIANLGVKEKDALKIVIEDLNIKRERLFGYGKSSFSTELAQAISSIGSQNESEISEWLKSYRDLLTKRPGFDVLRGQESVAKIAKLLLKNYNEFIVATVR